MPGPKITSLLLFSQILVFEVLGPELQSSLRSHQPYGEGDGLAETARASEQADIESSLLPVSVQSVSEQLFSHFETVEKNLK